MLFRSIHPSLLLAAALWAPLHALAQPHERSEGAFTVRGSTVSSQNVDSATARRHGIEPSPTRGILNVTVERREGPAPRTVQARVQATARNLTGVEREVPMKEVEQNGYVSYTGAYDFAPREVLDFRIQAQPQGASTVLDLTFRDRMWKRQ